MTIPQDDLAKYEKQMKQWRAAKSSFEAAKQRAIVQNRMNRGEATYARDQGYRQARDSALSAGYGTGNVAGSYTRDATNAGMAPVSRQYAGATRSLDEQLAEINRRRFGVAKPKLGYTPPDASDFPDPSFLGGGQLARILYFSNQPYTPPKPAYESGAVPVGVGANPGVDAYGRPRRPGQRYDAKGYPIY